MRVLSYNGGTAIVEVYLAPGLFSRNVVQQIVEKFEVMLAEQNQANSFLKRISRKRDFYAIIAIESEDFRTVTQIASLIEKRTRKVSLKVKNSIYSALNLL